MDWLVEMLAKIGMQPGTWESAIGQGAVMGAGTGGIGALLTGQNVGRGMAQGAALGGIGGAGAKGLGMLASPEVLAAQDAKDAALAAKFGDTASPAQGLSAQGPALSPQPKPFTGEFTGGTSGSPIARPIQNAPAIAPFNQTPVAPPTIEINPSMVNANPIEQPSFLNKVGNFAVNNPGMTSGIVGLGAGAMLNSVGADNNQPQNAPYTGPLSKFKWSGGTPNYDPLKFKPTFPYGYAAGGITDADGYASNAQNVSTYPNILGQIDIPNPNEVADPEGYAGNSMQLMADGGIADLGGYAAGGRSPNLLDGPGTGVSDDIPASIAGKQPARLAGGEYVIPSRIVSELGQGSTDAGAKMLDGMVQKINAGRAKTLGGKQYAKDTHAYKHLPV